MTNAALEKAGGVVLQPSDADGHGTIPEVVKRFQKSSQASEYRSQAVIDGIAFRQYGLFPPQDPLLTTLASNPGLHPFEKHLSGKSSPYQTLPRGGWTTGDAAAQRGMDLRLFYKEPSAGEQYGSIRGAVRYGEGACIGTGFWTSVHGGAVESALDEATAELAKMSWQPAVSTVDISFKLRKAVPAHTSLLVECRVKEQKGIRLWVEGSIKGAEGGAALASCEAVLADMTQFL